MKRTMLGLVFAVVLVAPRLATASTPRTWRVGGVEGWTTALRESVGVTSEGLAGLALATQAVEGIDGSVVWALLRDGDGRRMAAALAAIDAGLIVVDEPFVEGLVDSPPADPVTDDWIDPLTARELEVLELMAEGLSNKEIAGQLDISPHTAKFHVNTILGKLDAQTRTEAVVRAARSGLLSL